ncbi:hypothetical protein CsatB_013919 [Cannabis sativa]
MEKLVSEVLRDFSLLFSTVLKDFVDLWVNINLRLFYPLDDSSRKSPLLLSTKPRKKTNNSLP